jgi:phosphoribosylamine--glycine ligase
VRVLVIGSGGREHALARWLAADPSVETVIAAPGNPGIARVAELADVDATDPEAVAALAVTTRADLVVVGPEAPLVAGVADAVRAAGIACFGPSKRAARIEGSKAFAKDVMAAAGVPTAGFRVCRDEVDVERALDEFGPPYVVKDDGLAAGKGVVVTTDRAAALAHAKTCDAVVVEEFLDGPEVSLFVITDGDAAVPLLPAQDFKRVGDGDTGPNTGGMGAYAPLPWLESTVVDQVMSTVVRPTLAELARRGCPFQGLLYVGLALTKAGPRVVEFNARFGDPETQVVLPLLATPLGGLLYAAATNSLAAHPPVAWREGASVIVVLACDGYPGQARTGEPVRGAMVDDVYHAGTARRGDDIVSAGGRVLGCVGTGPDLPTARGRAYELIATVEMAGGHYRSDIAEQAARA